MQGDTAALIEWLACYGGTPRRKAYRRVWREMKAEGWLSP
jgi:hypothetical protein